MENKRRKRRPQRFSTRFSRALTKTCICKLNEVPWLTIREYERLLAASVFAFVFALLGNWSTYALQGYRENSRTPVTPIPLALKPNMIYLKLLATIKIDKLEKNQLHAPCFKMVGNLALALDVSWFQGKRAFEICGCNRDNKSQLILTILEYKMH